jgi:hypothetical protein
LNKLSDSVVLGKWTQAMHQLKLAQPRFASNRVGQVLQPAINE